MDPALIIARLLGPILAVIGIGMLANGATYREMAGQFLHTYPLIYLTGVLALLAGLTILHRHHRWTADWRSLITAIGWILCLAGTFRILAPQFVAFIGGAVLVGGGFFIVAGIVLLALGGFITFKGYVAEAAEAPLRQSEKRP
jgi:hypothetical protein